MRGRRGRAARFVCAGVVLVGLLSFGNPAGAQEGAPPSTGRVPTRADVRFDVGEFSASSGDWAIEAVIVSGDIDEGTQFTISLLGAGQRVLWTTATAFAGPEMRIPVTGGFGVREVTSTELGTTLVLGQLISPELEQQLQGGGGSTGQVATSMALVMIIAVILFRTPLPAAATQRWTK